MTPALYPPLDWIRAALFEREAFPGAAADSPDTTADAAAAAMAPPPLPDYLRDLIERRTSAAAAFPAAPLSAGQIRAITSVPAGDDAPPRPLGQPLGLLLQADVGGGHWRGWLVAPETAYASDRDLVLEDDDGPLDPAAGMVLTWAPVTLQVAREARILGHLRPARLAAALALAETPTANDAVAPRPGHIFAHDLDDTFTITSGTPLGGADDPRHDYQRLYMQLAAELASQPRQEALRPTPPSDSLLARLLGTLARPAITVAALTLASALALQAYFDSPLTKPAIRGEDNSKSAIQAGSAECMRAPTFKIHFTPEATNAQIVQLLATYGITIIAGPSETGELRVAGPAARPEEELFTMLASTPIVAGIERDDPFARQNIRCPPR